MTTIPFSTVALMHCVGGDIPMTFTKGVLVEPLPKSGRGCGYCGYATGGGEGQSYSGELFSGDGYGRAITQ